MDAKFFRKNVDEDNFAIRIDRNGVWYHDGTAIARDRLVKLFSTILHYDIDNNDYWLITPVEQGRIEVEDVPFIITDYILDGAELKLITNLGHKIIADETHKITCNPENGLAYIHVQNNVKARLNRSVREKLINIAIDKDGYNKNTGNLILNINDIDHIIAIETGESNEG